GIAIEEVVLPADIKFEPSYKSDLLNGITVLNGKARYFEKQNWNKKMYQQFKIPQLRDFNLTLIPYYTWANRGVTKMSVWIPVDY
ncbi:MAG: hypothetical protein L3J34_03525, partial [Flavobacteriaceae bacterium]|nr:hypothetical protein [Flavobacteriaceae bacterium]